MQFLEKGRKIIQNNFPNAAILFRVFISSGSRMSTIILQASISFAQITHLGPILPLDLVTFNKAIAVYSRLEGHHYFLVVEIPFI